MCGTIKWELESCIKLTCKNLVSGDIIEKRNEEDRFCRAVFVILKVVHERPFQYRLSTDDAFAFDTIFVFIGYFSGIEDS